MSLQPYIEYVESLPLPFIITVAVVIMITGGWIAFFITQRILVRLINRAGTKGLPAEWSSLIITHKMVDLLAWIAPALVFFYAINLIPDSYQEPFNRLSKVYLSALFIILLDRLISTALAIYEMQPIAVRRPVKGYVQLAKIILYVFGVITVFCILVGISPLGVLSGLGALMALLLLIFRDTILSFLASIQIAANDLVRVGDWIEAQQFGADGDVIDIALHTIKVQNWDKTIVVIPTYKLVEFSFKNWRGMQESGGRRIKRSIMIDLHSIRFLRNEEIEYFKSIEILRPYIDSKITEIHTYNDTKKNTESPLNRRQLTNIGTFRAYVVAYLKNHPRIHQQLTLMVRQLHATAEGVPIEVYAFTNTVAWGEYEQIQSDIFDHLFVALHEFGLQPFQNPTGSDFRQLSQSASTCPSQDEELHANHH
ncbi:mechanosensitive ion channel family protein [Chrysiogenes arsenatis]|uniref:mechanosensitive ion channel family protein n=1 Tax=Chrysiogenes arsenatis TaxID=309797 RepID=UPI0004269285|nr:mechanosensitive ion channel domain-containing protein [Chrysiogenes arsenatis]